MTKANSPAARLLEKIFGPGPADVISRAPGRVNLIGEHTDYNEGYVLPFAVDRYTEVALRCRQDKNVNVYSEAFGEVLSLELPIKNSRPQGQWSDYVVGVLRELSNFWPFHTEFDAALWSNVPIGAGLSSSASLEVAFAMGVVRLFGLSIEGAELVKLCQRAEQNFVGMPCGIMDQYVAFFAEPGKALFLDTRLLVHRTVPLDLEGGTILVVDSSVRRALAHSGYAERRKECVEAVRWLAKYFSTREIRALRDVDQEMLEEVRKKMPEVLWKRAQHVVGENARVLATVEALEEKNAHKVGELLYASHASLRDLFEVSIPEIDFLVEWGMAHGALGARLVGGGFGGVTLHLVPTEIKDAYASEMLQAYKKHFGVEGKVLEVHPASGAVWQERV